MSFTSDIVVGLLATGSLGAATWVTKYCRDRVISKQFPVAGTYASSYEDDRKDGATSVKATAWLEQRGRRLWGKTCNISDRRAWTLEARIGSGGRIYGTYEALNPNDDGLGGFFLNIVAPGILEGVWAGYDTNNKAVSAGAYKFRSIQVTRPRLMTREDLPRALALLGETLGRRYVTREALLSYLDGSALRFAFVAEDVSTSRLVAACTGEVTENGRPWGLTIPLKAAFEQLSQVLEFHTVGIMRTVAVNRQARGRGLGTLMAHTLLEALWNSGATCIVTIGWTDNSGCHLQGIAETLGFLEVARVAEPWKEDSLKNDYECPSCGQPCLCEGRIFLATEPVAAPFLDA